MFAIGWIVGHVVWSCTCEQRPINNAVTGAHTRVGWAVFPPPIIRHCDVGLVVPVGSVFLPKLQVGVIIESFNSIPRNESVSRVNSGFSHAVLSKRVSVKIRGSMCAPRFTVIRTSLGFLC